MNVSQLIEQFGGAGAMDSLGKSVGLNRGQVEAMIDSVAPMVIRGLQHQTATDDGLKNFREALQTGSHGRYIDNPALVHTDDALEDGRKILGHIFGDHSVNKNVASAAANRTGIDTSTIAKALPAIAGLIMAAMSKQSNAGHELGRSRAESNPLGSLASLFDLNQDGEVLDDIIGMASKLLR